MLYTTLKLTQSPGSKPSNWKPETFAAKSNMPITPPTSGCSTGNSKNSSAKSDSFEIRLIAWASDNASLISQIGPLDPGNGVFLFDAPGCGILWVE